MTGRVFKLPARAINSATVYPLGALSVFLHGTATRVPLYADAARTAPIANPQQADGGGFLRPIFLDIEVGAVDLVLEDLDGDTVRTVSNVTLRQTPLSLGDSTAYDVGGTALGLAQLAFYEGGTLELADIFSDVNLTTPLSNPVTADAAGVFTDVYLSPSKEYRTRLLDANGLLQFDVDGAAVDFGPPAAPVLSGSITDFVAGISWTVPDSHFPIAGYRLYNADTDALIVDQVGTTYTSAFLGPSATVRYYVVAYDDHSQVSAHSNTLSLTSPASGTITDVFTSSGTWTKRLGLTSAVVTVIGAGGGGAGGGGGPLPSRTGGGAAGGAYRLATFAAAALGATEAVTVGVGGNGGASVHAASGGVGGNNGTGGGTSSFGALSVCTGGAGGLAFTGSGPDTSAAGVPSGSGSSVTFENGGVGRKETALLPGSTTNSGAGGGQADSQAGGTAANSGTGYFGGNGGAGGLGHLEAPGDPGQPGVNYGGGGGGGGASGTSAPSGGPLSGQGGQGGAGIVVVVNHIG